MRGRRERDEGGKKSEVEGGGEGTRLARVQRKRMEGKSDLLVADQAGFPRNSPRERGGQQPTRERSTRGRVDESMSARWGVVRLTLPCRRGSQTSLPVEPCVQGGV